MDSSENKLDTKLDSSENKLDTKLDSNDSIITFIIPTIGRSTLMRTIISLKNQYIKKWKAIIIFDGVKCNIKKDIDNRIKIYEIKKKGVRNNAGEVRNFGLKLANTKWVGFVDDDDTISKNYINILLHETKKNPQIDCFIYRMCDYNNKIIIPKLNNYFLKINDVGISFIINKKIYKSLLFKPSDKEDYYYLLNIKKNKYKIKLLGNISYFIRTIPLKLKKYKTNVVYNPKFIF